jgi:hypothetical protein
MRNSLPFVLLFLWITYRYKMLFLPLGPVELFLIAFFALAAAFVGTKLGTCWVILEERWPEFREQVRDPYPSIAEKAVGSWMR